MILAAALLTLAQVQPDELVARQFRATNKERELLIVSTRIGDEEHQQKIARVLKYLVASTTRNPNLRQVFPQQVTSTVLAWDLDRLGWRRSHLHSPYGLDVTRGDWLVSELLTPRTYYLLLYGAPPGPPGQRINRAVIEGDSQVAIQSRRLIVQRGDTWETFDSKGLTLEKDSINSLLSKAIPQHDGRETIVQVEKYFKGETYVFQRYVLFNGQGKSIEQAPVAVVQDTNQWRGESSIRVPGSCINCHVSGLRSLEHPETKAASITREIARGQEDYLATTQWLGFDTQQMNDILVAYDERLTIVQAASELGTTEEGLILALSQDKRLESWKKSGIPRKTFEQIFKDLSQ